MDSKITPQSNGDAAFVKRVLLLLATALMCICGLAIFVPGPIQKNAYMGAEYCGSCHKQEFRLWEKSPHGRATTNLPLDKRSDRACLSCHATRVFEDNDPILPNVQCESCHGPGQYYASLHIKKDPVLSKLLFMKRPAEESCRDCHSHAANLWSLPQAMKKIDHWSVNRR